MKHISPTDAKLVERFLKDQRFRHAQTPKIYGAILRGFQRFVFKHSAVGSLSISILQQWLKERSLRWPARILCHHALRVERFLKWLQDQGVITDNPFVQLHAQYGPRTTPIVQSLVRKDAKTALEQLRRLPRFGSFLGRVVEAHVAHMRSLGYRYATNEGTLLRFDRFLQQHPELTLLPLNRLVECWSKDQPSPSHLYEAQKAGRIVSKAIHRIDPVVPVLAFGDGVARAARQSNRRPHLYSDEEVRRILRSALAYPSPKAPLRPISLFTMLMLAYCAGLRGREIARLRLSDVNLQDDAIDIRETKFFKHRRLPLAPGVMAALMNYLAARERAGAPRHPQSELFWSPQTGRGYSIGVVRLMLTDVLRRAGVKPARDAVGPRIHDLRHSMVSHRMRDWYKAGINPESCLAHLATYLGHKDIRSTLVYLNITPELLQEAGERFRKNGAAVLQATEGAP
jgi:site-specific recombinase XerD